jgi:hypothetical protein
MASLDDIPTETEYAQWRNDIFAIQHGGKPVWTPGQFAEAVGPTPNGRTWREINQDMVDFLATTPAAPPPSITKGVRVKGVPGKDWVGYTSDNGATISPDNQYRGETITRLISAPGFGGIVALDLQLNGLPLPQDLFTTLRIGPWTLHTADATYDATEQTWLWDNTGFVLVRNQAYEVEITR